MKVVFFVKILVVFYSKNFNMKRNENCDPNTFKKIITVIIAILSAIAGALGESATNFVSNLNLF